jgi:hypothetical protein
LFSFRKRPKYESIAEVGAMILITALLFYGISFMWHHGAREQRPSGSCFTGSKPDVYILLQARSLLWLPIDTLLSDAHSVYSERRRLQHGVPSLTQLKMEITDTYQHVIHFYTSNDNPIGAVVAIDAVERFRHKIIDTLADDAKIGDFVRIATSKIDIQRIEKNFAMLLTAYSTDLDQMYDLDASQDVSNTTRKRRPFRYFPEEHLTHLTHHCVLFCESKLHMVMNTQTQSPFGFFLNRNAKTAKCVKDLQRAQLVRRIFQDISDERIERYKRLEVNPESTLRQRKTRLSNNLTHTKH